MQQRCRNHAQHRKFRLDPRGLIILADIPTNQTPSPQQQYFSDINLEGFDRDRASGLHAITSIVTVCRVFTPQFDVVGR